MGQGEAMVGVGLMEKINANFFASDLGCTVKPACAF